MTWINRPLSDGQQRPYPPNRGIRLHWATGPDLRPVPFSSERRDSDHCRRCSAPEGSPHKPGCRYERCPVCSGPLRFCPCQAIWPFDDEADELAGFRLDQLVIALESLRQEARLSAPESKLVAVRWMLTDQRGARCPDRPSNYDALLRAFAAHVEFREKLILDGEERRPLSAQTLFVQPMTLELETLQEEMGSE